MALTRSRQPLVWIDCEMTGLQASTDIILSISCYISDHELRLLDTTGYHAIISTPKPLLDAMDDWCMRTHTASGLVASCQDPQIAIPAEQAATELLAYVKQCVAEPRVALLAGNSIHADKMFLVQSPWTPVLDYLHYRLFDVSALKEAVRRWCSDEVLDRVPRKQAVHSAKEDVLESLEEARFYMELFRGLGKHPGQVGTSGAGEQVVEPRRDDWGSMD